MAMPSLQNGKTCAFLEWPSAYNRVEQGDPPSPPPPPPSVLYDSSSETTRIVSSSIREIEQHDGNLAVYMSDPRNASKHIRGAMGWNFEIGSYSKDPGNVELGGFVVNIDKLRLDHASWTDEDIHRMAKFVSLPVCTHLSLEGNPGITAACARDLAKLLSRAPMLRVLSPPDGLEMRILYTRNVNRRKSLRIGTAGGAARFLRAQS